MDKCEKPLSQFGVATKACTGVGFAGLLQETTSTTSMQIDQSREDPFFMRRYY